jgi:hypothetical protein
MALTALGVYQLTAEKLRQMCADEALKNSGLAQVLRQRLVQYLRGNMSDSQDDLNTDQASAVNTAARVVSDHDPSPLNFGDRPQVCSVHGSTSVLVELLCQVSIFSSEEPEVVLRLLTRLEEIHDFGLVNDRVFITRVSPLVLGSLLTFLGKCLMQRGQLGPM